MKRFFYTLLGAAVCASCTNEPDVVSPAAGGRNLRFALSEVEMETVAGEGSRATFGENFVINWEDADDELGVFVYNPNDNSESTKNARGVITRGNDGVATVAVTVNDFQTGDMLAAYYPYNPQIGSYDNSRSTKLDILSAQNQYGLGNFNGSYNPMVSVPVALDAVAGEIGETVRFRSLGAFIEWGIYSSSEEYRSEKILSVSLTSEQGLAGRANFNLTAVTEADEITQSYSGTGNTVTVSVIGDNSVPAAASADKSVYAVVIPGSHTGCTVVVTTDKATYTWSGKTLDAPRAYVRRIALDLAGENVVREALPEEDQAVDLSAGGTANTYYVSQPGTIYKFKATVKGNGEAYTSDNLSYTAEDLVIAPKKALVLWYTCLQTVKTPANQQSPVLINSLTLGSDGYIYFQTPAEFVPGNALIVAIDEDLDYGQIEVESTYHTFTNTNVLWSWNIVAAEGYDYEATAFSKGGYTFMNRNVGALIDPEQAVIDGKVNNVLLYQALGNYYQYGRKDPFPTLMEYIYRPSVYNPLWFTPTYTPVPALDYGNVNNTGIYNQIFGRSRETIGVFFQDLIGTEYTGQELFAFLDAKAPHRWASKSSDIFNWHYLPNGFIGDVWSDDDAFASKTIYDPCPAGWRVMTHNAWTALTTDAVAELDTTTGQVVKIDGHSFLAYSYRNYGGSPDSNAVYGNDAAEIRYHLPSSTLISGSESGVAYIKLSANVIDEETGMGSREITFTTGHYITSFGYPVRCVKIQ